MRRVGLGEVATLQSGIGFPPKFQGQSKGLYPFAKVGDVSRVGRSGLGVLKESAHYISADIAKELRAKPVPKGSVLFPKSGEAIRQNHRAVVGQPTVFDNNVMAAVPGPEVYPSYLYRFLQTVDMYALASSTTVPSLRKSVLERITMPLPLISEQRRIADILNKADALRAKRREAITHLDSLGQSIFHDMFGSPSTNNRGWEVHTLGDMLVSTQYGTSEKSVSSGSVPVLRMGNLTYDGELDLSDLKYLAPESVDLEKYRLMPGDVLFNRTNSVELVGKTAMFSEKGDFTFAGYLIRLRSGPDLNPVYLSAFMNTADTKTKLRSMCKSIVGMANINAKEVQTIEVMLPPMILQQEFADRLGAISRLRDRYRTQSVELDNLFQSLQDRAFKGEL